MAERIKKSQLIGMFLKAEQSKDEQQFCYNINPKNNIDPRMIA